MELAVGTALQGNKYVIREVLSQSEVEVMYKATHTYLEQFVLLRSLNPAARQRDDFAQAKQQFIADVRSQAKQSTQSTTPILDCFEEGDLPFVVLQFKPELCPGNQQDVSPTASSQPSTHIAEDIPLKQAPQTDLVRAFDAAFQASSQPPAPMAPALAADSLTNQVSNGRDYEPLIFYPAANSGSETLSLSNHSGQAAGVGNSRSPLKHLKKVPIALLTVSLIGGCIGAGTGLALRFDSAQSEVGSKPRLSLFKREQSFPSEGNWPIQERYSPEPSIEQPIYRAAPSPAYHPPTTIQALPSEPVPSIEPYGEGTKPLPEPFESPSEGASSPANPALKLPADAVPLPEVGSASEVPPRHERLEPISPDNLLPPATTAPAPAPSPAAPPILDPPPLKSLPDSSGI